MRWLNGHAHVHPRGGEPRRLLAGALRGHPWVMVWTLAVAQVETPWAFYLIWALIGASLAGVLYEPAFAVLTATFGPDARRAITALTLVGGFASTVFMPLTQLLIATVGWRRALLVLGGLNLAVCLPLHALFVPARLAPPPPKAPPVNHEAAASTAGELQTIPRGRIFWGLANWFTAANVTSSGFVFQFVPLLTVWVVDMAAILTGVALIGPMQVAGRIVLMCFSAHLETREIGTAVGI